MVASHTASSATSLDIPLHLGMHDSHVASQGVVSAKRLLLSAVLTPDLDLLPVVDRVLVPSEVVRS